MTDFAGLLRCLADAGVEFIQCLGLRRLIHVKRAAGRPKDLEAVEAPLDDLDHLQGRCRRG